MTEDQFKKFEIQIDYLMANVGAIANTEDQSFVRTLEAQLKIDGNLIQLPESTQTKLDMIYLQNGGFNPNDQ